MRRKESVTRKGQKRVLVVEDNPQLLELTCLNLAAAGFSVFAAATGTEGVESARANSPDLIVLDLVLPGLDGFAVCEILRRTPHTRSIPILVLTGLGSELTRLVSLESGANDYLIKPTAMIDLVGKIREMLAPKPENPSRKSVLAG